MKRMDIREKGARCPSRSPNARSATSTSPSSSRSTIPAWSLNRWIFDKDWLKRQKQTKISEWRTDRKPSSRMTRSTIPKYSPLSGTKYIKLILKISCWRVSILELSSIRRIFASMMLLDISKEPSGSWSMWSSVTDVR